LEYIAPSESTYSQCFNIKVPAKRVAWCLAPAVYHFYLRQSGPAPDDGLNTIEYNNMPNTR